MFLNGQVGALTKFEGIALMIFVRIEDMVKIIKGR
jgi:hypothetical protein